MDIERWVGVLRLSWTVQCVDIEWLEGGGLTGVLRLFVVGAMYEHRKVERWVGVNWCFTSVVDDTMILEDREVAVDLFN